MDDDRPRRRDTDRVRWGTILRTLLFTSPITLSGIVAGGKAVLDIHAQWVQFQAAAAQVEPLREKLTDLEERIERLERWQCVLGWNPPETRNATSRQCGTR